MNLLDKFLTGPALFNKIRVKFSNASKKVVYLCYLASIHYIEVNIFLQAKTREANDDAAATAPPQETGAALHPTTAAPPPGVSAVSGTTAPTAAQNATAAGIARNAPGCTSPCPGTSGQKTKRKKNERYSF